MRMFIEDVIYVAIVIVGFYNPQPPWNAVVMYVFMCSVLLRINDYHSLDRNCYIDSNKIIVLKSSHVVCCLLYHCWNILARTVFPFVFFEFPQ